MAGPTVVVRILGDLASLAKTFSSAADTASSAGSRIHSAFSNVLGQLNASGVLGPFGNALQAADQALTKMGDKIQGLGPKLQTAGGGLAGLGLALSALGSGDQRAQQQLQAAIGATGKSYDAYATPRSMRPSRSKEHFGDSAVESQDALRILTQATGDPTKALGLLSTATDLAAAKHEDLDAAATQLGKTYNGAGRILKDFGISTSLAADPAKALATATKAASSADDALTTAKRNLIEKETEDAGKKTLTTSEALKLQDAQSKVVSASDKATKAHQVLAAAQQTAADKAKGHSAAIDALGAKLKGQGTAAADTFGGHIAAMKAKVEDSTAEFGKKFGPALTAAGVAILALGTLTEIAGAAVKFFKDQTILSTAATKIATAGQWLFNAAMDANPIMLVVLAIVALVLAVIVMYEKFAWFRDLVKDIWNWIKTNWPLLLDIIFGPIGLAIGLIIQHWQAFVAFFEGIPGDIARIASDMWHWVSDEFSRSARSHHRRLGHLPGAGSPVCRHRSAARPRRDVGQPSGAGLRASSTT